MSSSRPPVKFTYAEYLTLPEGSRYQLIEGDLIVSPAPTIRLQDNPKAPVRSFSATDTLTTDLLPGFSLRLTDVFAP